MAGRRVRPTPRRGFPTTGRGRVDGLPGNVAPFLRDIEAADGEPPVRGLVDDLHARG